MSIDFTKPLQTRDGRKVRLLCTDAHEPYPIVCLCEDTKLFAMFTPDGKPPVGGRNDLMNVPEEVTVDMWINVYDGNTGFRTKEEALALAVTQPFLSRRATLHIKRTVPVGHVDE